MILVIPHSSIASLSLVPKCSDRREATSLAPGKLRLSILRFKNFREVQRALGHLDARSAATFVMILARAAAWPRT